MGMARNNWQFGVELVPATYVSLSITAATDVIET